MNDLERIQYTLDLMREEQDRYFKYITSLQLAAAGLNGTPEALLNRAERTMQEVKRNAKRAVDNRE
jgi:hypothetical protein